MVYDCCCSRSRCEPTIISDADCSFRTPGDVHKFVKNVHLSTPKTNRRRKDDFKSLQISTFEKWIMSNPIPELWSCRLKKRMFGLGGSPDLCP